MTQTIERRDMQHAASKPGIETRADGGKVITGYAAVFYRAGDAGTEYRLFDDMYERIMPGAFDAAVREDDVRGMFDHSDLLGRKASGTLRLSVDQVGLRYEIDAPSTGIGPMVMEYLERGDVDGSSFAFSTRGKRGKVEWIEETRNGVTVEIRQIKEVELYDVGPVVFPAYKATTAAARSEDLEAIKRELAEHRRNGVDVDAIAKRLDMDLRLAEMMV